MEQPNSNRSKGGRPKKSVKKDQLLGVKCTRLDRKIITLKAEAAKLSVSEYLLTMGLNGTVHVRPKHLPEEILTLSAAIAAVGNNLNQIARKRNIGDELNAIDRAELKHIKEQLMQLISDIKKPLR